MSSSISLFGIVAALNTIQGLTLHGWKATTPEQEILVKFIRDHWSLAKQIPGLISRLSEPTPGKISLHSSFQFTGPWIGAGKPFFVITEFDLALAGHFGTKSEGVAETQMVYFQKGDVRSVQPQESNHPFPILGFRIQGGAVLCMTQYLREISGTALWNEASRLNQIFGDSPTTPRLNVLVPMICMTDQTSQALSWMSGLLHQPSGKRIETAQEASPLMLDEERMAVGFFQKRQPKVFAPSQEPLPPPEQVIAIAAHCLAWITLPGIKSPIVAWHITTDDYRDALSRKGLQNATLDIEGINLRKAIMTMM